MNKTPIDWVKNPDGTQGYTWNPITGCLNGCEYCYARKLANGRLRSRYLANHNVCIDTKYAHLPIVGQALNDPFYPRFWEDRLEPIGLTGGNKRPHSYGYLGGFKDHKPKGIFVCDMSDLFGIGIPQEWTQRVMDTIKKCPDHRFYLLTKQPQNAMKFLGWKPEYQHHSRPAQKFPDNVWFGATITNHLDAPSARDMLLERMAKVNFLSIEPFLGHMDGWSLGNVIRLAGWVIIGALTLTLEDYNNSNYALRRGLKLRRYGNKWTVQPDIEWVREIVEACDKAGIPVFLKDNLKPLYKTVMPDDDEIYLRQEMPK